VNFLTTMTLSLEQLLEADQIGAIYHAQEEAESNYREAHPKEGALAAMVNERFENKRKADKSFENQVWQLKFSGRAGRRIIAKMLGLPQSVLEQHRKFVIELANALKSVVDHEELIRAWREIKGKVGIQDINSADFPSVLARPLIVLFSADWCPPCRVMRPTFGQLVQDFDKAEVRYHSLNDRDWVWPNSQGVRSIPRLVDYFPNGARVGSFIGHSTQELWDTMNNLITLGRAVDGDGVLVCDVDSCRVEPVKK